MTRPETEKPDRSIIMCRRFVSVSIFTRTLSNDKTLPRSFTSKKNCCTHTHGVESEKKIAWRGWRKFRMTSGNIFWQLIKVTKRKTTARASLILDTLLPSNGSSSGSLWCRTGRRQSEESFRNFWNRRLSITCLWRLLTANVKFSNFSYWLINSEIENRLEIDVKRINSCFDSGEKWEFIFKSVF